MSVGSPCYGLFVDTNNNLYCSQKEHHQVVRKSLNNFTSALVIIAGTGCNGATSRMLYNPCGIFVTINSDLYVADASNNRIQLFRSGDLNATTVAGEEATETIDRAHPTAVVVDEDQGGIRTPGFHILRYSAGTPVLRRSHILQCVKTPNEIRVPCVAVKY